MVGTDERRARWGSRAAVASALVLCLVGIAGCGIPRDPDGTLERVTGGVLRVGASVEPGLVEVDGERVTGPMAELATGFASSIDADVTWTVAGEETLVSLLEEGRIDLAVGGFTASTPWSGRAGLTRGYTGVPGSGGDPLVMLVPLGENAMLTAVETYLDEEVEP